MNFRKAYSKKTVIRAVVQGVFIGLAAVFIIAFVLNSSGEKKAGESVPAAGPAADKEAAEDGAVSLFVKQHGVFSSKESAAEFAGASPSLKDTVIVPAEGQFYIWGAAWLKESDVVLAEKEDAFKKQIRLVPGVCKNDAMENVKKALTIDDLSKIQFSKEQDQPQKGSGLEKKISAITAFTKDPAIARLHLLAYYTDTDPCFKIQF